MNITKSQLVSDNPISTERSGNNIIVHVEGLSSIDNVISKQIIISKTELKHWLFYAIYYASTRGYLTNLEPINRIATTQRILKFISFIRKSYSELSLIPDNLLFEYYLHLKSTTKIRNSNSFRIVLGGILAFLNYAIYRLPTRKIDLIQKLHICVNHSPHLNSTPKSPKRSMSELFSKCPYNDTELVKSLRLCAGWILEEFGRHRGLLKNTPSIATAISNLHNQHSYEKNYLYKSFSCAKALKNLDYSNYYSVLYGAIVESEDQLLLERVFIQNPIPQQCRIFKNSWYTHEELTDWIARSIGIAKRKGQRKGKKKKAEGVLLNTFTYPVHEGPAKEIYVKGLVGFTPYAIENPTNIECFCMQSFLATERIQASGMKSLTLEQFEFTEHGVQIHSHKGRREKFNSSIIHKPSSTPYKIYNYWHNFISSLKPEVFKVFPLLPYANPDYKRGQLWLKDEKVNYFDLFLETNSYHYEKISKDLKEDFLPFLWLLKKLNSRNSFVRHQNNKFMKLRKTHPSVQRRDIVKKSAVGLSIEAVARSAQRLHKKNNPTLRDSSTNKTQSEDPMVQAELSGHGLETKLNVYDHSNYSTDYLAASHIFAANIALLMEEDANKLRELINNNKIVRFKDISKELGLNSNVNEYHKSIESLGGVGLYGEIELNNQNIIVTTPITYALMHSFEKHLISSLNSLYLHQVKLCRSAIVKLLFINECKKHFPAHMQKKGKEISEAYSLPFPKLE